MLRLLREPALVRVVAVTVLVMMVALSAPMLIPAARWIFALVL